MKNSRPILCSVALPQCFVRRSEFETDEVRLID